MESNFTEKQIEATTNAATLISQQMGASAVVVFVAKDGLIEAFCAGPDKRVYVESMSLARQLSTALDVPVIEK
jgi:hypothetical protein